MEPSNLDWENNLITADASSDHWDELEALFAEPTAPAAATNPFDWPQAPAESASPPLQELTLPPVISPQGLLWAEISHLFQTPAFSQPQPEHPVPPLAAAIDALSQAMRANDGEAIQALVNQIQQTHGDPQSIEIFLAATRNLCG